MHRPTDDDSSDAALVPFPVDGTIYETRLTRKMRERRPWRAADRRQIATMIPGLIVRVLVAPGQQVRRGQGVVVLEAMKMRNEVQAPRDGTVQRVLVAAGQTVAKGALLIELE
jgi:biotin carboxyl carrier protein